MYRPSGLGLLEIQKTLSSNVIFDGYMIKLKRVNCFYNQFELRQFFKEEWLRQWTTWKNERETSSKISLIGTFIPQSNLKKLLTSSRRSWQDPDPIIFQQAMKYQNKAHVVKFTNKTIMKWHYLYLFYYRTILVYF